MAKHFGRAHLTRFDWLAVLVTVVDKYVSLLETLRRPVPRRETAWLLWLLALPGLRP